MDDERMKLYLENLKELKEMKEKEDYEWRVRARVDNLKDRQEELGEKILQRNLDIILNHDPSKKDLYLREINEMEKESDNLESYINTLEKKNRD
jgi:DNA-binding ferritin-like protein